MADAADVRASRDGDRFHYYWAARQALRLLDPTGDLEVVGVEGLPKGDAVEGEEVIDVAEYYSGCDFLTAAKVRYIQVKHSTFRADDPITASELEKTLKKFAAIYREESAKGRKDKTTFVFVANRLLNNKVQVSLDELASRASAFTHTAEVMYLRRYMEFGNDTALEADFCQRFKVDDGNPGVADMERVLQDELQQYLPGGGTGSELLQLIETVSRRATTLVDKQTLQARDVLVALGTTEDALFPAPSTIEQFDNVIATQAFTDVAAQIRHGPINKFLITAEGGVGKSVLASTLKQYMPNGSETIVYDCFAGGDYRKASSPRHEHHVALTQISNELASSGRCLPLIPADANPSQYMQVFMHRIKSAAKELAQTHPDALLAIVIDAADNAAMAATEQQQRTFVTDIFREDWPTNFRLIQLCRPERKHLLRVPLTGVAEIPLAGFQKGETLQHLRRRFPDADEAAGAEFHELSGGNPRVQSMALEGTQAIAEPLHAIQIAKTQSGVVLDSMLAQRVNAVADQGYLLPDEHSQLCEALATLPPPIPLTDLAAITKVDVGAIRSFATALGRGLHTGNQTLQFRDEPTETWFRTTYNLDSQGREVFTTALKPLAKTSPYVANTLPQLYFEAGMLDDLVALALSDVALPAKTGELQAKEIARSRARYALCAMLHAGRNKDAALLAIKVGEHSSGHSRKIKVFQTHTDLTARFLEMEVEELCAGKELAANWPGSSLHVEAALYSHHAQFKDLARGRFRSAFNNFVAIFDLPGDNSIRANITANEVADLAMVAINIDGPSSAAEFMSRWRPREFVRNVAAKLCSRLADAGRYDDLAGLVVAKKQSKWVHVSVAETMFRYNITPPTDALKILVRMLCRCTKPLDSADPSGYQPDVRAAVWILAHGLRQNMLTHSEVVQILSIQLPSRLHDSAGSDMSRRRLTCFLLGYALRAHATGVRLQVEDVARSELTKQLKNQYQNDRQVSEFRANIPPLLPWAECWLASILETGNGLAETEYNTLADRDLRKISTYEPPLVFFNGVAEIATRILASNSQSDQVAQLATWHRTADAQLERSRLDVAQIAMRSSGLESFGLEVVSRGIDAAQQDRTDADYRIESLIKLARTTLAADEAEARAIFSLAVVEAEQVGDDLYARWQALVRTSKSLGTGTEPARAYRLFQIGETLDRAAVEIHQTELAKRLWAMHEPTYFTAVSRTRDRRTLQFGSLLTPAFEAAAANPGQPRPGLLALYAFEPATGWKGPAATFDEELAALATSVFEVFTRFEHTPDYTPVTSATTSRIFSAQEDEPPAALTVRFADTNFTTEVGWNKALGELGWQTDTERRALAAFALEKHPAKRPAVLDALGRATLAKEDDLVQAIQATAKLAATPALKHARKQLAATFAKRFASDICTRGYGDIYQNLRVIANIAGTTDAELAAISFQELGRTAHQLTYEKYFFLAANLANSLHAGHAGEIFDALATLFEDIAPSTTSSDGPYKAVQTPPADAATGIGGTIWCALGDMASEIRWQAAHSVLLLVRFGCKNELDAIARFADGTYSAAAFLDARFPFYALHARMWLLLALARAAQEPDAAMLTGFVSWLVAVVRGPRHAANQVLAQRTLAELSRRGLLTLDEQDAQVLTSRLTAEWVELDYRERKSRPNPLTFNDDAAGGKERGLFFFDFENYWCDDVAEIFGSTQGDVARRAAQVVTGFEGCDVLGAGKDPRSSAGVYRQGHSYLDGRSWPDEDNLSFYGAIHALLTVGAELAVTETAYKEPEHADDSYWRWLAQFLPQRPDGRLLADRRDPPPIPSPMKALLAQKDKKEWPWSLSKDDFEETAGVYRQWITVWAMVDSAHEDLEEDVRVESALVPRQTARSLLVTLQTPPVGPSSFIMPSTDNEHDRPTEYPYEIIPWLNIQKLHSGIDETDKRSGGVRFPPPRPGDLIISRFALTKDDDQRRWLHDSDEVFRSRIWNNRTSMGYDRQSGTSGERLEVNREFLTAVLQELDMILVLQVGRRRVRNRPRYEYGEGLDDNGCGWLDWSGKTYLIDPQGQWLEY